VQEVRDGEMVPSYSALAVGFGVEDGKGAFEGFNAFGEGKGRLARLDLED
jgi:hypothetical protein